MKEISFGTEQDGPRRALSAIRGRENTMADVIPFPDRPPRKPTVLLVDDEYLVRGVLSEILKEAGFAVVPAENGAEAIHILSGLDHIDLVFSDIKMAPLDGFEVAKWAHEHKPGLPVILASGYSGKTNMAAELNGVQFFRKPFDFDAVVEKIRDTLGDKKSG
jgi:DNA-binding NtrC family response regulator